MNKKIFMVLCVVVFSVGSLFASDLSGRDYVNLGSLGSVSGTLKEAEGEWYLDTPAGEYEVHLGYYEVLYPEGLDLKSGAQALIRGFIHEHNIATVSINSENKTWHFRDEDGRPLWSGKGNRRNENTFVYEK